MDRQKPVALVVDDQTDLRILVSAMLEQEGFDTIEGKNAEEAVSLAVMEHPDVVVLDVMMPGKDGFEAYREIREDFRTTTIPVIMLTAVNEHDLGRYHTAESMGEHLGVPAPEAFIDKPIEPQTMHKVIAEVVGN
ncbi:MAG TPA: response regulator [Candidatus Hydrogenedentes bacterium]|nr:response regulator [Candidatus Hydrogenedentota bacterium]